MAAAAEAGRRVVSATEYEDVVTMLGDMDVHVAAQQNELRVVHAAATAQTAELQSIKQQLLERQALIKDRDKLISRLRLALTDTVLAADNVAGRATEAATKIAKVLDTCAVARNAYCALHRHASEIINRLIADLAESREAQHRLQAQLVETGLLLLQTHAALGTRIEKSAKLRHVRNSLVALSDPLTATMSDASQLEVTSYKLSEPSQLGEDNVADSYIEVSRASLEVAAAVHEVRISANLFGHNEEDQDKTFAQNESDFVAELVQAIEERKLMEVPARASFHAYEALLRSGTSMLLRPPVSERWVTSMEECTRRKITLEQTRAKRIQADKAEAAALAREEGRQAQVRMLERQAEYAHANYEELKQKFEANEREAVHAIKTAERAVRDLEALRADAERARAVAEAREEAQQQQRRALEVELTVARSQLNEWQRKCEACSRDAALAAEYASKEMVRITALAERSAAASSEREAIIARQESSLREAQAQQREKEALWEDRMAQALLAVESVSRELAVLRHSMDAQHADNMQRLESMRSAKNEEVFNRLVREGEWMRKSSTNEEVFNRLVREGEWMRKRVEELTSAIADLRVISTANVCGQQQAELHGVAERPLQHSTSQKLHVDSSNEAMKAAMLESATIQDGDRSSPHKEDEFTLPVVIEELQHGILNPGGNVLGTLTVEASPQSSASSPIPVNLSRTARPTCMLNVLHSSAGFNKEEPSQEERLRITPDQHFSDSEGSRHSSILEASPDKRMVAQAPLEANISSMYMGRDHEATTLPSCIRSERATSELPLSSQATSSAASNSVLIQRESSPAISARVPHNMVDAERRMISQCSSLGTSQGNAQKFPGTIPAPFHFHPQQHRRAAESEMGEMRILSSSSSSGDVGGNSPSISPRPHATVATLREVVAQSASRNFPTHTGSEPSTAATREHLATSEASSPLTITEVQPALANVPTALVTVLTDKVIESQPNPDTLQHEIVRDDNYYMERARQLRALRIQAQLENATQEEAHRGESSSFGLEVGDTDQLDLQSTSSVEEVEW
eukprot:scaffold98232_cov35-Tisochrysis_lutea.AAC.1